MTRECGRGYGCLQTEASRVLSFTLGPMSSMILYLPAQQLPDGPPISLQLFYRDTFLTEAAVPRPTQSAARQYPTEFVCFGLRG